MVIQNALGSDSSAAVSKERCGLKWLPNERVPISPGGGRAGQLSWQKGEGTEAEQNFIV